MYKVWEYIREYNPLFAYSFFITMAMSILYYMLPLRIEEAFGGIFWVGIVYGIGGMFCLLLDIPIGDFSDIVGKKSSIIRSAFVLMFVALMFSLNLNPYQLLLFFSISTALGVGICSPAVSALVSDITPKRREGRMMGVFAFVADMSDTASPVLAGFLGLPFIFCSILMALGALVTLIFIPNRK